MHSKPELGLLSWGNKTSAPGSDTDTLHKSAGFSSKLDNPMLSKGVQFQSPFDAFHHFHLRWGNCLKSLFRWSSLMFSSPHLPKSSPTISSFSTLDLSGTARRIFVNSSWGFLDILDSLTHFGRKKS